MNVEVVADYACHTGENPLWNPADQRLYWTDIPAGKLYRFDPATGVHELAYEGRVVGGFTLQADGTFLLFLDRGTVAVWDGKQLTRTVVAEIADEADSRFNDVIADPEGRVFCGTMSVKAADGTVSRYGRLHRLDRDGTLTTVLEGVGTSNGMGFTRDLRHMYHTDTPTRTISLFDYDRPTGAVTNRRPFVHTPTEPSEGRPDGMTVDADGNVWGARWDGSCVVCYSPDGREVRRVTLPTRKVSSVTIRPDADEMYLTTAGGHEKDVNGPTAGALYRVTGLGVRGVPEFASRVGI